MKSVIISCFPGCGKTYLYMNNMFPLKILDLESIYFSSKCEWPVNYVSSIISKGEDYDILLISQHEEVLQLLNERGYPFCVVSPNNTKSISPRKRGLIKQQWFGRFWLRDKKHALKHTKSDDWLYRMTERYEEWTSIEHLSKYSPLKIYLLDDSEYLSDIILTIYNETRCL